MPSTLVSSSASKKAHSGKKERAHSGVSDVSENAASTEIAATPSTEPAVGTTISEKPDFEHGLSLEPPGRIRNVASLRETKPLDEANVEQIRSWFTFQGYIEQTEHRGISPRQLKRLTDFAFARCGFWYDVNTDHHAKIKMDTLNLYQLNEWVIKPGCFKDQCAFVELVTNRRQIPDWFISHWWGEPVAEFLMCMDKHTQVRGETVDSHYWVCAYANRQHNLGEDVVADPKETSFYRAMNLTKGILLILDQKGPATPFRRVWCAFEEALLMLEKDSEGHATHNMGVLLDIATTVVTSFTKKTELLTDGITVTDDDGFHRVGGPEKAKAQRESTFPIKIIKEGLRLSLEKAESTNEDDRVHILNCLVGRDLNLRPPLESHENYTKINRRLRAVFAVASWRQAVEQKGGSIVDELGLPEVLAQDIWKQTVNLNFAFCRMLDTDLNDLAKGLSRCLRVLCLDFRRCLRLSDVGVRMLAQGFPESLRTLKLNFAGCRKIGSPGLIALAHKIPKEMQIIDLNFYACPQVNQVSVGMLGTSLPQSLRELDLNFSWCEQVCNPCIAVLVNRLPLSLRKLSLHFRKTGVTKDVCDAIKEMGISEDTHFRDNHHSHQKDVVEKHDSIADDAPGRYIVVRDKTPVISSDDLLGEDFTSPLAEMNAGVFFEVLEVKSDPVTCMVWGRTDKPEGWALLLGGAKGRYSATADKPDAPGKYIILRDRTHVGYEAERVGDGAGTLNKGAIVDVQDVQKCDKLGKTRGQIKNPYGWITLFNHQYSIRIAAMIPEAEKFVEESAKRKLALPLKVGIEKLSALLQQKVGSIDEVEKTLGVHRAVAAQAAAVMQWKQTGGRKPIQLAPTADDDQVDHPGKYVIIRNNVEVRKEAAVTGEATTTFGVGHAVEVQQILQDEKFGIICGMLHTNPPTWISLYDIGKCHRMATPVRDDDTGKYTVLCDDTSVDRTIKPLASFAPVATLKTHDVVQVVKVVHEEVTNRIRGKILQPAGWITIVDLESRKRWAVWIPGHEKAAALLRKRTKAMTMDAEAFKKNGSQKSDLDRNVTGTGSQKSEAGKKVEAGKKMGPHIGGVKSAQPGMDSKSMLAPDAPSSPRAIQAVPSCNSKRGLPKTGHSSSRACSNESSPDVHTSPKKRAGKKTPSALPTGSSDKQLAVSNPRNLQAPKKLPRKLDSGTASKPTPSKVGRHRSKEPPGRSQTSEIQGQSTNLRDEGSVQKSFSKVLTTKSDVYMARHRSDDDEEEEDIVVEDTIKDKLVPENSLRPRGASELSMITDKEKDHLLESPMAQTMGSPLGSEQGLLIQIPEQPDQPTRRKRRCACIVQ